ncbi:MAG TPA: 2-C-methyl-D-erythritol 4-phosphate cytidylyltransferase [Vicinamibacterales bacterium]|nr:2-C-methyl-D-erythritol 4-phosphate cytidylyltransferase [Vicinamibacterales bacterium]
MRVAAIVAAGGLGRRLGGDVPKQFIEIGGSTILEHSVRAFASHPRIDEIVVVLPRGMDGPPPGAWSDFGKPLAFVSGGERRQDSVAAGFDAVGRDCDLIVVHDAARPFVNADTITRVLAAADESGAAIAALRASDTVKEAAPGEPVFVQRTVPREAVWLAQTPQAFARRVLADAIELGRRGASGTDEAALAEQAGHPVRLVEGDPANVKITTPADLEAARARLGPKAEAAELRVGTGYDSHRFVAGRPLLLGGVEIPHTHGLDGHSDADALCHAITDAVLGAAALGDIGRHFPDTDPRWKGADSVDLLRQAVALVHEAGYRVVNVDAVVVAEKPVLAPYAARIRERLAGVLQIDSAAVNVKGKTNERMGAVGRGEGIVVHAVAMLMRAGLDAR